jgi:hypothetical protein
VPYTSSSRRVLLRDHDGDLVTGRVGRFVRAREPVGDLAVGEVGVEVAGRDDGQGARGGGGQELQDRGESSMVDSAITKPSGGPRDVVASISRW